MILVASTNMPSKNKINDFLSHSFTIFQRFHQGFPLSMLLCITMADTLAIFIDADMRIEGIHIGNQETKTVNFPDGASLFLRV